MLAQRCRVGEPLVQEPYGWAAQAEGFAGGPTLPVRQQARGGAGVCEIGYGKGVDTVGHGAGQHGQPEVVDERRIPGWEQGVAKLKDRGCDSPRRTGDHRADRANRQGAGSTDQPGEIVPADAVGDRVGPAFSGFQSLEVVLPAGVDGGAGGLIELPPFCVAVGPMRGGTGLLVDRPSIEVGLDAVVEGAATGEEAVEGDTAVPLEGEPELQPVGGELCRVET